MTNRFTCCPVDKKMSLCVTMSDFISIIDETPTSSNYEAFLAGIRL